jgi:glycosyltransferase involved in cell wall biosynthesis
LQSVAAQDYPDVEHIIVDGGSTDGTLDAVRQFGSHAAKVISEPDKGLYDAMNKGWKLATGEFVGYLHADDVFADESCVRRIAERALTSSAGAIAGDVDIVRENDIDHVVRHYSAQSFRLNWLRHGYAPPYPGYYVRRSVYDRVGGYDLRYPLASDFDFIARMLYVERLGWDTLHYTLVKMRQGGASSNLAANFKMYREVVDACRRHGISGGYLTVASKYLSKPLQYFRRSR